MIYVTADTTFIFPQTFSMLHQVTGDKLEGSNVFYYSQPDAPVCLTSGLIKSDKGQLCTSVFAVSTEAGHVHFIRMPLKGKGMHAQNQHLKTEKKIIIEKNQSLGITQKPKMRVRFF